MKSQMEISVISPVYKSRDCLLELYTRLKNSLLEITEKFEIILVNDSCPQDSWDVITELCSADKRVKGINLSRNFGQHHAITAGLDHAKGKWIVVMDCDLQDRPEEIVNFYKKANEGYDIVLGRRIERFDNYFRLFASKFFYKILKYFTDVNHDSSIANYGIYSHKVIQSVNSYRESNRVFPLLASIVGFKRTAIPITHSKRTIGESSYTFKKMFKLAIDSIITHSNKPLRLSIKFGFLLSLFSILYTVWILIRYFCYGAPILGWTSLMIALFFMFGVLFGVIGILGLYIGKIFDETKARPLYIMQETINLNGT